jgi:ABC-type glycerol-3-phosphate transport system substrate-binding protein
MTLGWGRAGASIALVAAVAAGTAGCGGDDTAKAQKPSASATAKTTQKSVAQLWRDAWAYQVANPCEATTDKTAEEAGCQNVTWDLVTDVRKVRTAMNADTAAGTGFYSAAYVMMDRIDTLAGDMSDDRLLQMRDQIRAQGVDLNTWITAHPSQ